MQVTETARRDVERGNVARDHPAVEDDAGIRPALVGGEVVDDRVAARLLLAVAGEPHVRGQPAGPRQPRGGLEQEEELALVVGDPSPEDLAVPDADLERRRLP